MAAWVRDVRVDRATRETERVISVSSSWRNSGGLGTKKEDEEEEEDDEDETTAPEEEEEEEERRGAGRYSRGRMYLEG